MNVQAEDPTTEQLKKLLDDVTGRRDTIQSRAITNRRGTDLDEKIKRLKDQRKPAYDELGGAVSSEKVSPERASESPAIDLDDTIQELDNSAIFGGMTARSLIDQLGVEHNGQGNQGG